MFMCNCQQKMKGYCMYRFSLFYFKLYFRLFWSEVTPDHLMDNVFLVLLIVLNIRQSSLFFIFFFLQKCIIWMFLGNYTFIKKWNEKDYPVFTRRKETDWIQIPYMYSTNIWSLTNAQSFLIPKFKFIQFNLGRKQPWYSRCTRLETVFHHILWRLF